MRRSNSRKLVAWIIGLFVVNLTMHPTQVVGAPKEFTTIMTMKSGMSQKKPGENLRIKTLREAAETLAFQAGVKWRYAQLLSAIEERTHELDRIFNFTPLLIDGRVLPPVIQWANKSTTVESDEYATSVEAQYRIIASARIVSTAPSWRDYICSNFDALNTVAPEVLPNTSDEKRAWQQAVAKGWASGTLHADEVFAINMSRLVSEYRGILRFKMLVERGIVSVPVLAEGNLGVQVGENILSVNQQTFRITVPAAFRAAEQWRGK